MLEPKRLVFIAASHEHKRSIQKTERASQTGDLHNGIVLKNLKTKQGSRGTRSQPGYEVKLLTFPHPVGLGFFFGRTFLKHNVKLFLCFYPIPPPTPKKCEHSAGKDFAHMAEINPSYKQLKTGLYSRKY